MLAVLRSPCSAWCIFRGSLHGVEEPLRRVVSHAACELPVPAPAGLWCCPSRQHSSRADTSATATSSLPALPRCRGKCGKQGRVSVLGHLSPCRGTGWSNARGTGGVSSLAIFCIPCHWILSLFCTLCSCSNVTLPGTAACAVTWFANRWQGLMHV